MTSNSKAAKHASSYDEIRPLVEFCKFGRLFDVQEWIASGKPVNLPFEREKRARRKSPLRVAMDKGFHSLVQVLVEGGALMEENGYSALHDAVWKRRLDLIELLVRNGADINSVSMHTVFESWDPEIIEYFISRGADVETDYPLAGALIERIRTATRFLKRYKDRFPSFQDQADIALRHHCYEGNLKWVSLLAYAGADPWSRGPKQIGEEPDPEEDMNALQWAAFGGHLEVFKIKKLGIDPSHPEAPRMLRQACYPEKDAVLRMLLERGFNPSLLEDGGSSIIDSLLHYMSWDFNFHSWNRSDRRRDEKNIDTQKSREKLEMLHLIVRHGAKWRPDEDSIKSARRFLLKLIPDYTVELIWILSGYGAAGYEDIEQLLNTPTMRAHIANHRTRISDLIQELKNGSGPN